MILHAWNKCPFWFAGGVNIEGPTKHEGWFPHTHVATFWNGWNFLKVVGGLFCFLLFNLHRNLMSTSSGL